jgi:hypothetical protein
MRPSYAYSHEENTTRDHARLTTASDNRIVRMPLDGGAGSHALGANYGWPIVEGMRSEPGDQGFSNPEYQWPTSEASPSGLTFVDGTFFLAALRAASVPRAGVSRPPQAPGVLGCARVLPWSGLMSAMSDVAC